MSADLTLDPDEYRYCHLRFHEREILCDDDEPDRFLQASSGRIEWGDPEDSDGVVVVGSFSLYVVDLVGALTEGVSYFDVFDTEQSTLEVFETLYDLDTYELRDEVKKAAFGTDYPLSPNILILNRLTILPAHRGHAAGLLAMRALIEQFRAAAGLAVLKAFPLQFEGAPIDDEESDVPRSSLGLESFTRSARMATARLKRYYGLLGFTPVPRTEYMVLDPSMNLPSYDFLLNPPQVDAPKRRPRKKFPRLALAAKNGRATGGH